jgi:glutamate-1-semialdehyde 2,1-aminomutase
MVECAEMLTSITPWAEWCYFAKNGTDATSIAVRIARSATGKRVVLRAPHAYHGSAPLWSEGDTRGLRNQGVLEDDVRFIAPYTFNDIKSVRAAMDTAGSDLAGIMVSAFKWDYATPHEAATAEFLRGVRRLCDERGAVLICDDVRSSFRIHPAGTWADPRCVATASLFYHSWDALPFSPPLAKPSCPTLRLIASLLSRECVHSVV